MDKEQDKLSALFRDFSPSLSDDRQFMERLEHRLELVETVKKQLERDRRRNRLAVVLAAAAGFVSGTIVTLYFPYIAKFVAGIASYIPVGALSSPESVNVMAWCIVALTVGTISFSTYDLALTRQNTLKTGIHVPHY